MRLKAWLKKCIGHKRSSLFSKAANDGNDKVDRAAKYIRIGSKFAL